MSNQQKVVVSLTVLSATCSDALAAISATNTAGPRPELAVILKDYISILTLIYSSTTKIALALKPSAPTHSAAIAPIQEISKQIAALSHCISLVDIAQHGATLRNEIEQLVQDTINAVKALSESLLTIERSDLRNGTGSSGEGYMIRTGAVHDCVERAKQCSSTNIIAASKKWKLDEIPLNDALREVTDMIDDNGEDADDEDGWDELGFGPAQKLTDVELQRTKKVNDLLKLTVLLHKRIRVDLLAICSVSLADKLVYASKSISPAMDDLIATTYAPQNVGAIKTEVTSFMQVLLNLDALVREALDMLELNTKTAAISIENRQEPSGPKSTKKWTRTAFVTCFQQIRSIASFFDDVEE